ncbi:MAG: type I-MYXAN CRISPR-associated protein Cmx8 [Deltaproteobacteria bacterium]|nr:type I-MYXAN CRISPR-associated protein Cmx8 [Deltaproteobacteria bacterium]
MGRPKKAAPRAEDSAGLFEHSERKRADASAEGEQAPDDASAKPTKKGKPKTSKASKDEVDEAAPRDFTWELAGLSTTQHRAGLAGFVMLVQWVLARGGLKDGVVLSLSRLDATGVTLTCNRAGMQAVFDAAYAASSEEKAFAAKLKKGKGDSKVEIPAIREDTQETTDAKSGKVSKKKVYIYPVTVPHGAFLLDEDPTRKGSDGLWVKLWRDFVWSVVRGVPATRRPYEARADGDAITDGHDAFDVLCKPVEGSAQLVGTTYLGAQASTADGVDFKDRERQEFLLQFWPFAISLFVPTRVEADKNLPTFDGSYVVVLPDVSELDTFCELHMGALREREAKPRGYRPEGAVVELPEEGPLLAALRLHDRLSRAAVSSKTVSSVVGYEVVHMAKEGNNVRVYRTFRMAPSREIQDKYKTVTESFREYFFRRQQIVNVLAGRRWFDGYDRLAQTLDYKKQFMGSTYFCRDARQAFALVRTRDERKSAMSDDDKKTPRSLETLVRSVVLNYVSGRVRGRTGLDYKAVKASTNKGEIGRYNEEVGRASREIFLAARSRTGADFREFFTGTLCSQPQFLSGADYERLAHALRDESEDVRTLTMLAIASVSGVSESKPDAS